MLNINKKALSLLVLTLLVASLLLISPNIPMSAQAQGQPVYLDGPSLNPIHLHSNITLQPIHMHHMGGVLFPGDPRLEMPNCTTDWEQLYPEEEYGLWHLSSWEDKGEPFGELSPNDQIDMTNWVTEEVEWFHVDRMTITLLLSGPYEDYTHTPAPPTMAIELKWPVYDPFILYGGFLGTLWHEVWTSYSNVYVLNSWMEDPFGNPDGILNWCDSIDLFDINSGLTTFWHVEDVATDLILRWKMMNPIDTWWHQLYPTEGYCTWWQIKSWSSHPDPYCDRISPLDTIDMVQMGDPTKYWYIIDRVTITINVTDKLETEWKMLELKTTYFEEMYNYIKHPLNSLWHEVYPIYSSIYELTWWDMMDPMWDNCNGVLDPCDYIELYNIDTGIAGLYHIVDMCYDIIVNPKIADPINTDWHEIYPEYCNWYQVVGWQDTLQDGFLNPSDYVDLALYPTGLTQSYHVVDVTLTLNITADGVDPYLFELNTSMSQIPYEDLYRVKIDPLFTYWDMVWPYFQDEIGLVIEDWEDNCNGVLDYCDWILLSGVWCHVEELNLDMVVVQEETPPPPPWYKKPPYPNYAPSGMPDFDQKQDAWGPAPGLWTWCGPVAVANSLWWFDSKYDPSNILTAYPGVPHDHHVLNVDPFVRDLAWWMDTDGQRTGVGHTGTFWQDMVWGIDQYLRQQGENDTLEVHFMEFPEFYWIEEEVERCQDVVLLLEFWIEIEPGMWIKADPYDFPGGDGGHYVTCAGVNSTTSELLFSDPFFDAAEAGWPGHVPVPHPGHTDPTVHNDTKYVSHDAYLIAPWIPPPESPYPGVPVWEVWMYLQQNMEYPPNFHTFIRAAIATSPLAEHDVAVINVTTSKAGCLPRPTVGKGYTAMVNVTVENQGGFTETFNVTAYADSSVIGEMQTTLNPAQSIVLTFTWNTTGYAYGNYTISATADTVLGETDTGDNTLIDGTVYVGIPGDVNYAFGLVDMKDIGFVVKAFGGVPGHPKWNTNADINNDSLVDMKDIGITVKHFGQSIP
jgi:hypothetical protein